MKRKDWSPAAVEMLRLRAEQLADLIANADADLLRLQYEFQGLAKIAAGSGTFALSPAAALVLERIPPGARLVDWPARAPA